MPFKRKLVKGEADKAVEATRESNVACIYARVSTEKQGEDGKVSIPKQIEDCQTMARQLGLVVSVIYTEKEKYRRNGRLVEPSGEYDDRPQFRRMIADGLAGKFQHIVAWHEWRVYRGVKPAVPFGEMLEKSHVAVHLVNGGFDMNMLYIKASIGKMELDAIRQRIQAGNHGKLARGFQNGVLQFGYKRVRSETGQLMSYERVESALPWFELLAQAFIQHIPVRQIARELPPPPGFMGRAQSVRYYAQRIAMVLSNPIYRGLVHQNGVTRPGLMPPMWDAATIAAIDSEWARRDRERHTPRSKEITLSGWLHCGYCGRPMAANGYGNYPDTLPNRVYSCMAYELAKDGVGAVDEQHPNNSITERTVLSRLQELFASVSEDEARALTYQLQSVTLPGRNTHHADVLNAELDRLHTQADELSVTLKGKLPESLASFARDELTKCLVRIGEIEERLTTADQERPAFEPETVVAEMLRLATDPTVWALPMKELRPRLERALPLIFVGMAEVSLDRGSLPAARLRIDDLRADALRVAREYVSDPLCSPQAALKVLGQAVAGQERDTLAAKWWYRRTVLQEEKFATAWRQDRDY